MGGVLTGNVQAWLFTGVVGGILVSQLASLIWGFEGKIFDTKDIEEAERVVRKKNFTAYTYLASFGLEDDELRTALDMLAFSGKIILDADGNVVGRLLPKSVSRPKLQLVVDNKK